MEAGMDSSTTSAIVMMLNCGWKHFNFVRQALNSFLLMIAKIKMRPRTFVEYSVIVTQCQVIEANLFDYHLQKKISPAGVTRINIKCRSYATKH